MKKTIIVLIAIALISAMPPKDYTFKLTDQQVQTLWLCLEASNAPHLQVKEIQSVIQSQYQAQQDTAHKNK